MANDMGNARADRDEWRRRVERWKDSGLTAKEFAAETGINAGTLQFWRYKLKRGARGAARPNAKPSADAIVSSIVEVRASASAAIDHRFEIELSNGRRIRLAAAFEPAALKLLLAVLEAA